MSKYTATFNRNEKKYVLTPSQRFAFEDAIRNHVHADTYGEHTICNIYFDNNDYESIEKSLDKPLYKEKLRLRSYNTPKADSPVYLEIKKKFSGVVYKRRIQLSLDEANAYLFHQTPPTYPCQTFQEIDWLRSWMDLKPMTYIAYDRIAYAECGNESVRLTLDTNIRWRQTSINLEEGEWGNAVDEGITVLEVKVGDAIPLWLSRILDQLHIYPNSYSKYGRCYTEIRKSEEYNV
ncbi:polyphosphate polymerase domain-containing protein [Erysipelothrix sp. HDW6C]|uniref:polyphosphate polymerase domain-containing protein n=1 Tax=Erysipelothrix sp. HDW6C TaxID=2714930 RepID=UPI001408AE1F|nr:polyphosphate polymerase domain-containing protein [Erysipelothrix sp. HDW6C]QIK69521.1 polyphosphate polymerase domain-containing protein [Erysipelothrix sp. HDW6C]